jgi:hypothetical protein
MEGRPARSGGTEAEVRHIDTSQCLAWYGNVQIILSLEPPTFEFMRKIVAELDSLAKKVQCGTGALLIIRSNVSPPTEEARAYIKQELSRSSMLAAAQVVEGTGFRGAAMRSVLTMLQLASRAPYPMKVFDDVEPGARWLAAEMRKRAGDGPDGIRLTRVANEVRRRFIASNPPPMDVANGAHV